MEFTLKIFRGSKESQYWEEFVLELTPFLNVISALMEIQKNPLNHRGEKTTPVVWEQGCLEEVCGSCTMLIDGKPRQACTALIRPILENKESSVITVAPLTKFPLMRDLIVNRNRMFDNLKTTHSWIDADTSQDRGFGPKISPDVQEVMYTLSTCMTCGCCTEACPQVSERSAFMGPAPISQVRLFNDHPTGALSSKERLHALMGTEGISGCGNAQNCVQVCPKNIPLTESIALMGRAVTKQAIKDLFGLPDQS